MYNITVNETKSFFSLPFFAVLGVLSAASYSVISLIRAAETGQGSTLDIASFHEASDLGVVHAAAPTVGGSASLILFVSLSIITAGFGFAIYWVHRKKKNVS